MELQTTLTQIGFTEYEAKVYLALLEENPVTGYQVSKRSGVPRSMVYESLARLRGRGAVLETISGRATLYRPLPPDVLLERQEEEHRVRMQALRQGLGRLYAEKSGERTWTVSGQSAVHGYARQMIRAAQEELYLVIGDSDLETLSGDINAASARGVAVSTLLTGEGELDCGRVVRHPPLESELQELTGTLLVVADSAEVLVSGTRREIDATITHNPNLVMIARQFVWMEMFTQRIYARLGQDLLARLDPEDRAIFESLESNNTRETA
jgi:Cd2+/Zn2+-exporting ATPase